MKDVRRCAILCGSAPEDFRQRKLVAKYDFLVDEGGFEPGGIVMFLNGVHELLLESTLNNALEEVSDEMLLYLCTESRPRRTQRSCGSARRKSVGT